MWVCISVPMVFDTVSPPMGVSAPAQAFYGTQVRIHLSNIQQVDDGRRLLVRMLQQTATGDVVLGERELGNHSSYNWYIRLPANGQPNDSFNLRFALILATPGHTEYDPIRAQSMLREILTQEPLMTRSEIALARIYLVSTEESIVLESEARRLRQSNTRAARTQEQAINQRLANVEAENRRLRTELAEAENKLEAITSIERAIREQDQTPD